MEHNVLTEWNVKQQKDTKRLELANKEMAIQKQEDRLIYLAQQYNKRPSQILDNAIYELLQEMKTDTRRYCHVSYVWK